MLNGFNYALLEYLRFIGGVVAAVAWPVSIVVIAYFMLRYLKHFGIVPNVLKSGDHALEFKSMHDKKMVSDFAEKIVPDFSGVVQASGGDPNAVDIKEFVTRSLTNFVAEYRSPVESGSNANGKYWRFANGCSQVRFSLEFSRSETKEHTFPAAFPSDNLAVTFVGDIVPKILSITPNRIVLKCSEGEKGVVEISIFSVQPLRGA